MQKLYNWSWVEARIADAIEGWHMSARKPIQDAPRFSRKEQQKREKAYDEGLRAVEREVKRTPRSRAERLETQDRIVSCFAQFSATALALDEKAVQLLTDDFLPVGTKLARWARRFDPNLSMADIVQACRNAWTACGMQPLLGERVRITPSILGYSLLYPYSDNFLDRADVLADDKAEFCERFRRRLRGERLAAEDSREAAVGALVGLIEGQYPRRSYPQVFDCLLAIHRAQEESIAQMNGSSDCDAAEVLRMSVAKGGTSVVADACLAHGLLSEEESQFAFEWGVLLQLGDDLQDVHEDMERGSDTLFSRAAGLGVSLDDLVMQLLNFNLRVGARMDKLPNGTEMFKELLKMSWRSLVVGAVAESHEFFSPGFLGEMERTSPFRFEFLRSRRQRLGSRQGLYAVLFDAFLEARAGDDGELPSPDAGRVCCPEDETAAVAGVAAIA